MAAVPAMASVQGKLKTKIEFDPSNTKKKTFQAYKSDMEAYFEEFVIGYVLKDDAATYAPADGDGDAVKATKALKEYNMKIARRFLYGSMIGEADTLARSPDNKDEPKLIWKALCDKYDAKEVIDIEAKTTDAQHWPQRKSDGVRRQNQVFGR